MALSALSSRNWNFYLPFSLPGFGVSINIARVSGWTRLGVQQLHFLARFGVALWEKSRHI